MLPALASGALFGLLNLGHCAGMCGPLAAAGCSTAGRSGPFQYQLGRTLAYAFAGAMCGHVGRGLQLYTSTSWAGLLFASLTAAACLYAARELARSERRETLVTLRGGRSDRRALVPALFRLLPRSPLALGSLSALLPCGLLATALLASVATGSADAGAAFMTGFAASSGSAILASGWAIQRLPQFSLSVRRGLACLLVAGAVVTVARPIVALGRPAQPTASTAHTCH